MLKSRIHHGLALASAATLLSLSCGALAGAAAADPKPDHTDHGKHLGQGQGQDHGKGPTSGHQSQGHQSQGHQNNGHANGHANGNQGHQNNGHANGHDHAPGQQGQDHGQGHGQGPSHPTGQGNGNGSGHNPPGNNGTVKIFGPGDAVGTPSNNPHPGCTFGVEWFGFDEGQDVVSTVTFASQAPTSDVTIGGVSPSQVFVGGDPAGGGTDLDGRETYTLTFSGGAPHPKQGYHVKLTVATPYSLGNDTKTKVFWVEPCAAEDDTTTSSPSGGAGSGGGDEGDSGDQGVEAQSASAPDTATDTASDAATGVEAETATAGAAVPTSVDAGENGSTLADWARSPWPLVAVAGGLTLVGVAIARRRSRA